MTIKVMRPAQQQMAQQMAPIGGPSPIPPQLVDAHGGAAKAKRGGSAVTADVLLPPTACHQQGTNTIEERKRVLKAYENVCGENYE